MCIPCHASWLTHQVTRGTRASCINQPMVNVTVTIIKLEHKWLQIAPGRKTKTKRSYAFNVNIDNICKWEKSILQSAFFDVTRGRGCRRNSQVAASGFHLLPFQAYDDDPVPFGEPDHLAQFAWNILCCVDFSFSIIFYCIYRWLELSGTTQWSHWLAFRTALRHKDEPDSIMLRIK